MRTQRWRATVLALGTIAALVVAPGAFAERPGVGETGTRAEVSPAEDDPADCTKATAESQEQCGARGRDHFANADHEAPIEACSDRRTAAGGKITRIRPDGPRHDDGSLAFVPGACVYLPAGYDRSGFDYPVVYLLHGGGGDQADWVTFGAVEEILDASVEADPANAVIAVMPDGRSGQWYDYEDGSFLVETYVLDHLIPYVDARYRTIADRTGRSIAGLSNGGYGAVHLAAKRPDMFSVAGGMSSNLGGRTFAGLGPDGGVHHQGSVPFQLASNLDGVDVILDIATSCSSDVLIDLCATIAVDLAFWPDHIAFSGRMSDVGHVGDFDYRETEGGHKWRWWREWLETRDLPFILDRLEGPRPRGRPLSATGPPPSFRYRSIAPSFKIWDHQIEVERDVREFLDLTDVTRTGFTVQGSGEARITTAPRYAAGHAYLIEGAAEEAFDVVADRSGRLTIPVDLGPSHTHDQFSTEADLAEQQGGYWVTRSVTITDDGAPGSPRSITPVVDEAAPTDGSLSPSLAASGRRPVQSDDSRATATGEVEATPADPTEDVAPDASTTDTAASPIAASVPATPGPQLIPTLLFLALLTVGAGYGWRRHRREVPA